MNGRAKNNNIEAIEAIEAIITGRKTMILLYNSLILFFFTKK